MYKGKGTVQGTNKATEDLYVTIAIMTHPDSKFTPFTLPLPPGATLSGIVYVPPSIASSSPYRPLIIAMHGAACNAHHFDVDSKHTASLAADAFSIPVVSINRPCYRNTTSFLPVPTGSTFYEESGKWEHERIFPALWQTYGIPNGCTAVVVLGHSLAAPGMIAAAAMYAQDPHPAYPLAGLIFSGWGSRIIPEAQRRAMGSEPLARKNMLMLNDPSLQTAADSVRQYMEIQTEPGPPEERSSLVDGTWAPREKRLAAQVNVPIMFALAEHDWLWYGNKEHVQEYEARFSSCPRFDGSVVRGAPHAIEWSHQSQGWYARCFGFGLEISAWKAIKDKLDGR